MDAEVLDKESRPLIDDDGTAPIESNTSLLSSPVGDGGVIDQHADGEDTTRRRRQIPTMVCIAVPMIIFLVVTFLAAAFMPKTETPEDQNNSTHPQEESRHHRHDNFAGKKLHLHADIVAPSLLSIRDHKGLLDVRRNTLYKKLKHATFRQANQAERDSAKSVLQTDKNEVRFGDALTLAWNSWSNNVKEEDILVLYCPAGEMDPRRFRDAATISQVRATHTHEKNEARPNNLWSIPSFPIVREESCQFRLYSHSIGDTNNDGLGDHHYALMAATDPISLTSSKDPTLIHLGLTGKASEMYIQFVTGDSGQPIVEIAKNEDIHASVSKKGGRDLLHFQEMVEEISWTKIKGESTSYVATDMCNEPATSTEPGFFVSPGHLHTVKATDLEPNTDYLYRVGLSFGQGIKWSDTGTFTSSPPPGAGSPSADKPAVTFLALADQGCAESKFKRGYGPTPPDVNPAQQVTDLIASIIEKETINSVHYVGDLSYADGVASVWDAWMQMIQPIASQVPVMVGVGNHEYDHSEGGFQPDWGKGSFNSTGGECGVPISKRFAAPDNGNSVFWYSYDQSLVHMVVLSTEHNLTAGSEQHVWFEKNLASVNRTLTPWIIVEMHRPVYNPDFFNWLGPMVSEGLQEEIEYLLYTYQVDIVLSGHYHSYFRSCQGLHSYKCSNGGPTYITVGTGGSPLDDDAVSIMPNQYTEFYDKSHWGVGKVSVFNSTAMHWEFIAVGGNVTDEIWLTREH